MDYRLDQLRDLLLAIHEKAGNPAVVRTICAEALDVIDGDAANKVVPFKRPATRPTDNPPPNGAA